VAYEFANQHRDLLRIPESVEAFHVHRRLRTEKRFNKRGDTVTDIVFRVSWDHVEENDVAGLPRQRRVTAGTTLVINADRSQDVEVEVGEGYVEFAQMPVQKLEALQHSDMARRARRLRTVKAGKGTLLVRARLTSDLGESQRKARDQMLSHLIHEGLVELDQHAIGPDGELRPTIVHGQVRQGVVKLSGTARMLHIASKRAERGGP
jgi:hypothetical protein